MELKNQAPLALAIAKTVVIKDQDCITSVREALVISLVEFGIMESHPSRPLNDSRPGTIPFSWQTQQPRVCKR